MPYLKAWVTASAPLLEKECNQRKKYQSRKSFLDTLDHRRYLEYVIAENQVDRIKKSYEA